MAYGVDGFTLTPLQLICIKKKLHSYNSYRCNKDTTVCIRQWVYGLSWLGQVESMESNMVLSEFKNDVGTTSGRSTEQNNEGFQFKYEGGEWVAQRIGVTYSGI